MQNVPILVSTSDVALSPSSIPESWILEGSPVTRSRVMATSADQTAMVIVWDCTAGRFNWFYNLDETVSVIEGGMSLTDHTGTRRVAAGDVVYFPAGSQAMWTVDSYVRKIAVVRQQMPANVSMALRVMRKLQRMVTPASMRLKGGFAIVRPDHEMSHWQAPVAAPVAELEDAGV